MRRSRACESELSIHSQNGRENVQKIKFMQVNGPGGRDKGLAPWQAWWGAGGGGGGEGGKK